MISEELKQIERKGAKAIGSMLFTTITLFNIALAHNLHENLIVPILAFLLSLGLLFVTFRKEKPA